MGTNAIWRLHIRTFNLSRLSGGEIGATETSEDSISDVESAVGDDTNEKEALLKMLEQSPEMMALLKAMLEKKNA